VPAAVIIVGWLLRILALQQAQASNLLCHPANNAWQYRGLNCAAALMSSETADPRITAAEPRLELQLDLAFLPTDLSSLTPHFAFSALPSAPMRRI